MSSNVTNVSLRFSGHLFMTSGERKTRIFYKVDNYLMSHSNDGEFYPLKTVLSTSSDVLPNIKKPATHYILFYKLCLIKETERLRYIRYLILVGVFKIYICMSS